MELLLLIIQCLHVYLHCCYWC